MTDRINALRVTLEKDIRDDDVEVLVSAIKMLHWVLDIKKNVGGGIEQMVAEDRVRRELGDKLWEVLYPKKGKS